MKITEKDVEYVARLARLELTAREKPVFCRQLETILEYIDKLSKVNTDNVAPTSHVVPLKNVYREDEAKFFDNTDGILSNAPEKEGRLFKVKKVIE